MNDIHSFFERRYAFEKNTLSVLLRDICEDGSLTKEFWIFQVDSIIVVHNWCVLVDDD